MSEETSKMEKQKGKKTEKRKKQNIYCGTTTKDMCIMGILEINERKEQK